VLEVPRDRPSEQPCLQVGTMNEAPLWENIESAPSDRDLELAVIEGDHVHQLIFACRRTAGGWVNAATRTRVLVNPTHWRLWPARD
jgi:hypothetical protein